MSVKKKATFVAFIYATRLAARPINIVFEYSLRYEIVIIARTEECTHHLSVRHEIFRLT